jgi:hypothetical protein
MFVESLAFAASLGANLIVSFDKTIWSPARKGNFSLSSSRLLCSLA